MSASDGFGYDEGFAGAVAPALDLLHDGPRRLRVTGAEHLPEQGAAVIAVGHDGPAVPDVVAAAVAVQRGRGRTPRVVAPEGAFAVPFLGPAVRRLGAVPPQPADALRLLRDGDLVLVRIADRHDAAFAELALGAGVPVIACAVTDLPYLPLPGPLAGLPLPARVRVAFTPPVTARAPGGDPGDRAAVLDLADDVRGRLAEGVRANLT